MLNTLIILIKLIVLVHSVLSMEGKQIVWSPWYLMPKDKLRKVECKFCDNVISDDKDRMRFHLGYQYDGNGRIRVVLCSKAHPWVKTFLSRYGGLVLPPLNDMEILTHIPNGCIGCGHGNFESFNGKIICSNASNGRGSKFHPLINNIEGFNRSTNKNT